MSVTERPRNLQALRDSGRVSKSVKQELRDNFLKALAAGEELFPGIVGYEDTVTPQIVNAVLSRHNFILLGLRGQAKTRLIRMLTTLLEPLMILVMGGVGFSFSPIGRAILNSEFFGHFCGQDVILNEAMNVVVSASFEEHGELAVFKEMLDDGRRALVITRGSEDTSCGSPSEIFSP